MQPLSERIPTMRFLESSILKHLADLAKDLTTEMLTD